MRLNNLINRLLHIYNEMGDVDVEIEIFDGEKCVYSLFTGFDTTDVNTLVILAKVTVSSVSDVIAAATDVSESAKGSAPNQNHKIKEKEI